MADTTGIQEIGAGGGFSDACESAMARIKQAADSGDLDYLRAFRDAMLTGRAIVLECISPPERDALLRAIRLCISIAIGRALSEDIKESVERLDGSGLAGVAARLEQECDLLEHHRELLRFDLKRAALVVRHGRLA